jgi:hypothetical protein
MFCSHDFISGTNLSFALWITKANSFLNMILQCSTDGSSLLKSHPFLSFQMHQHITIIISIAKGTPSSLLMCLVALSGLSHIGTMTPICIQQFMAKEHLRNKCLSVSSFCLRQSSQLYESNSIFLLLSMALMFSLFCSKNQKKTFCFIWHEDRHIQPNAG